MMELPEQGIHQDGDPCINHGYLYSYLYLEGRLYLTFPFHFAGENHYLMKLTAEITAAYILMEITEC